MDFDKKTRKSFNRATACRRSVFGVAAVRCGSGFQGFPWRDNTNDLLIFQLDPLGLRKLSARDNGASHLRFADGRNPGGGKGQPQGSASGFRYLSGGGHYFAHAAVI